MLSLKAWTLSLMYIFYSLHEYRYIQEYKAISSQRNIHMTWPSILKIQVLKVCMLNLSKISNSITASPATLFKTYKSMAS